MKLGIADACYSVEPLDESLLEPETRDRLAAIDAALVRSRPANLSSGEKSGVRLIPQPEYLEFTSIAHLPADSFVTVDNGIIEIRSLIIKTA